MPREAPLTGQVFLKATIPAGSNPPTVMQALPEGQVCGDAHFLPPAMSEIPSP